jgi:hypothetical protein
MCASGKKRALLARHVRNRRLYHAVDRWAFCAITRAWAKRDARSRGIATVDQPARLYVAPINATLVISWADSRGPVTTTGATGRFVVTVTPDNAPFDELRLINFGANQSVPMIERHARHWNQLPRQSPHAIGDRNVVNLTLTTIADEGQSFTSSASSPTAESVGPQLKPRLNNPGSAVKRV